MKKLLLFITGISILFLAGCYNGNQSHGKNTFYMKHGLCEDCKNSLRIIMTHQETKYQNT